MEFRILGPVEVYDDEGAMVDLGGPRQRAVLARLLAAHGAVVSAHMLIDDLYGGAPPPSAVPTLQSYISNLRRAIEPDRGPRRRSRVLVGRPPGYALVAGDVDATRFAELVGRAEFLPAGEALASVQEALGLWRGMPFGEFCDEPWAIVEVSRLRELRVVAAERRARALLDLGRPHAVVADLEAETMADPLRERLWCLLALALYRTGRQTDALAVLRRVGRLLADEYGLDPGPELRSLEEDILRQADSLGPVTATALVAAPAASWPGQTVRGRERELAELAALTAGAGCGGVAVAAVSGEPGIGKTRLLEAFADQCADLGHLVVWGRCHDTQGTPALWPWLQVLAALEPHFPPPEREALAGLLDDHEPAGPTDAALLRRNRAVAQWLTEAARSRPLVIVLDDAQWADPASLELLRDVLVLIRGLAAGAPLTLVTAFRGCASACGTTEPPVEKLLCHLAGYDLLRLRLTGLRAEEVRAIAEEMGADVDQRLAGRLTARTGGNPFFVRESMRLFLQGRDLDAVPDAVAEVVRRRLAGLGPRARDVLQVAALIGRDFDPAVVAEACRGEVYGVLDLAVQTGVLVPRAGRMAFSHDLVRETLVRDIPPLRKAVIHREVMASLSSRPGTDVAVIAHHAVEAGPAAYGDAAGWARAAAEQAGLRLAYEEAAVWWNLAVKAHDASAGDPHLHVELLLRQVDALLQAGDAIGARRVRAEAVLAADRAGDRERSARALTALDTPSLWTRRDPYEAVELRLVHRFETALRELPQGDGPQRARLLGGLAQELYDGSGDARCDSLSAEAVEMARRLGDPDLLMRMLNARHLALPQPLNVPELMKVTDELHELAVRTRAPGFELLAQMMYSHNRLELFDLAGADQAAARCETLLERLPLPWPRFQHTLWCSNRLALDGRFEEAGRLRGEAEGQAGKIGVWHARGAVAMGRIGLHCQQGTMAQAGPLIEMIAGIHPSLEHDARILRLCGEGRTGEALELAAGGWPAPPYDWSWLSATCLQAAARAALGDVDDCREGYATLLPYSGRISALSAVICMGPVDWYLALLASAMGDRCAADRHLEMLERLAELNGLSYWRDRARAALRALPVSVG
ncbi:AfsR/SARP family transcriptional regulator [Sphaerisporangium fuscum]|uniref:AfsR/SARP family transcriptional regulator n=1 Tax=Sphaerisporangium fuscum TaxID=2835868 RepID=UPI001BDBE663|nr:AfsR/SARP family transcriptional regulator [Sphaerisporangium fuscum]